MLLIRVEKFRTLDCENKKGNLVGLIVKSPNELLATAFERTVEGEKCRGRGRLKYWTL